MLGIPPASGEVVDLLCVLNRVIHQRLLRACKKAQFTMEMPLEKRFHTFIDTWPGTKDMCQLSENRTVWLSSLGICPY